ncbi:GreA/GreB family elongation factor [Pelagibacterium lacus]|uniref:Transcription elongation factor GreA/GreB C-terminal domain-containing protein n=1 Tax=Pelagibacterium lacus TaxID=2282655 RepID=A0A369W305_9HYPH|nr:GreA/GreB family elongation factor [Pelagibacterium lacus]RDE08429.1 hypothetical protein DVH29_11915 [Pelagibacterium lacus]
MSRAFVKEIDDVPEQKLPERTVSSAPNLVTRRGAELIAAEIDSLTLALETLDGKDAEHARRDLRYWEARRATMQLVERSGDLDAVGFGTEIAVKRAGRMQTLRIVGEDEADPRGGYLAYTAPLAQALEEAEIGETVEFEAGGRVDPIEIVSIKPL